MDLSNKSLALLLLAAVVISLGGTMITLTRLDQFEGFEGPGVTGMQTAPTGITNLTVEGAAGCNIDTDVDFGSGPANSSTIYLTTETDGYSTFRDCSGTGGLCTGMQINNTGNVNLNVTFNSSDAGSTFLEDPAATDSFFRFFARNGTDAGAEQGCVDVNGTMWGVGNWENVPTAQTLLCNNLTFNDASDMMTLEFNVTITPSEPQGEKRATINVVCTEI